MLNKDFISIFQSLNLCSLNPMPCQLPIIQNKKTMQNFSIEEIEKKMIHHKLYSDRFQKLLDQDEINAFYFLSIGSVTTAGNLVDCTPRKVSEAIRDFFSAMADYHRIELMKWQSARGIDPIVNS